MIIVKLPSPKAINHDQLNAELGYPVALRLGPGDLCEAVQVEDAHEANASKDSILATVAAHIATPREEAVVVDKVALLEAELLSLKSRIDAQDTKLIELDAKALAVEVKL